MLIVEGNKRQTFGNAGFYLNLEFFMHLEFMRKPVRSIVLWKGLPNYKKLAVLYHEFGHHSCRKSRKKCKCRFDPILSELHAHEFCMRTLYDAKEHHSLFYAMQTACLWAHDYLTGANIDLHGKAAFKLFRRSIWRKSLTHLKSELHKWILETGIGKYVVPEAVG